MDYGMIGKIEKAKRYAEERTRIHFKDFSVAFDGENGEHTVTFDGNQWKCDCHFFQSRNVCSHTMALEKVLEGMLPHTESVTSYK
ncbi:MAG: SWIM zinc finger family protein [Chloroflexota bacterium]